MYYGKIVELAENRELYEHPLHPYTLALLSAVPMPDPGRKKQRVILGGEIPSPTNPPGGCAFHPRCPYKMDICDKVEPEFNDRGNGHFVACHMERCKICRINYESDSFS